MPSAWCAWLRRVWHGARARLYHCRMDGRLEWRSGTTNRGRAQSPRAYGRRHLTALLVLSLLVTHLLLMAHEPHHEQHIAHEPTTIAAMSLAVMAATPHPPTIPHSVLDGCPVAQATLPGLLLLPLLAFALGTRAWASAPATPRMWRRLHTPPATLSPGRRRALLQVFLI